MTDRPGDRPPDDRGAQQDRDKPRPHPMGEALEWVSRITAVALEMVLPGLAGQWLDSRLGTSFLALAGFALGITAGIWHLLLMTGAGPRRAASARGGRTADPAAGTKATTDSARTENGDDDVWHDHPDDSPPAADDPS